MNRLTKIEEEVLGKEKLCDGSGIWVLYKVVDGEHYFLKGFKEQDDCEAAVNALNEKSQNVIGLVYDCFEIPTDI